MQRKGGGGGGGLGEPFRKVPGGLLVNKYTKWSDGGTFNLQLFGHFFVCLQNRVIDSCFKSIKMQTIDDIARSNKPGYAA